MASALTSKKKYIPGSDAQPEEIFDFPFLSDVEAREFIKSHGQIMFIIRGPPGTAKSSLSSLIKQYYESAVLCSADNYFDSSCVDKVRNRWSLKASHDYCQSRVTEELELGTHPIIVQNTHMKRSEVKTYIDFANEFGYTIIMAITLRKFIVDPKVLAKTNRKGLNEAYFRNRLSQWEEYYPQYLGWFLGVDDSSFMLKEAKQMLGSLIGDGKFCNCFSVFSEEGIWEYFQARANLSCIATYNGSKPLKWKFYLSDTVQESYGKCFPLIICGYIVTKSDFAAIVQFPQDAKKLVVKNSTRSQNDELCRMLDSMAIEDSTLHSQLISFKENFEFEDKTAVVTDWEDIEDLDINYLSIIVLGQRNKSEIQNNVSIFLKESLGDMVSDNGKIDISEYAELDDGTRYHRLPNNVWFVHAPQKITVNSVFTACYL